jgi:CRISPR/Cas system-associated exonuclease Cas4 (RecB family)
VRLAALPSYGATRDEALLTIRWSRKNKTSIFDALCRVGEIDGLSEKGRKGLGKLGAELAGLEYVPAWALLTAWLFERSDYLRPLLEANGPVSQQALIAIYHFLKMCGDQAQEGRRKFLARIRRIEALNYDSTYRAVSAEAADLDAVRIMTIHGSKGLEFQAVHLPALATRYMPTIRQWVRCPPPPTLPRLASQPADHDDEEAGLFFVALSRARDYLSLSRAEKYTSTRASASKFLQAIARSIRETRFEGSGKTYKADLPVFPQDKREAYPERELGTYLQCPARYKYEVIEDLNGLRDGSPYVRFHGCVYVTVGWLEEQRAAGMPAGVSAALERLKEEWSTRGPVGYPFEKYYFKSAQAMVTRMAESIKTETMQYGREEWTVDLDGRSVTVTPDRVLIKTDGVHVQRVRTGRKTKSEPEKILYAVLRRAAEARFPDRPIMIETYYLATGETVAVLAKNETKKLAEYRDAIDGIEQGMFPPDPEPRRCASCQSYFLCGA